MKHKQGFTLIELVVVIAILAILLIIAFMTWRSQFDKAKDASRKDHLQRLSIAFEDYYNDHECYPPADIIDVCGSDDLSPYLNSVPCDPLTKTPYCYITDTDNPGCFQTYRLLSSLDYTQDPVISKLQCHGEDYCGYETQCATAEQSGYNYGVSSLNIPVLSSGVTPPPEAGPSPTPSSSPSTGKYACYPGWDPIEKRIIGVCNSSADPWGDNCPGTFEDPQCKDLCKDNPENWCNP